MWLILDLTTKTVHFTIHYFAKYQHQSFPLVANTRQSIRQVAKGLYFMGVCTRANYVIMWFVKFQSYMCGTVKCPHIHSILYRTHDHVVGYVTF